MSDVVVIGVGNRMMGDDAAGPAAIERLAGRLPDSVALVESIGDATHLLDTWRDAELAVVVDAVVSGSATGSIHRVEATSGLPLHWRSASTHLVGVAEAVELGAVLAQLPHQLVIYGIEIGHVEPGSELSLPVERAVDEVVESLCSELGGGAERRATGRSV